MTAYLAQIIVMGAVFVALAASYSFLLGSAGIFSATHAAFFGIGAYTATYVVIAHHAAFPLDLLVGAAAGAAGAVVTSLLVLRLSGEQVVVATLALQIVFLNFFDNATAFTGGTAGKYGIGRPEIFGMTVAETASFAVLAVVVCVLLVAPIRVLLARRVSLMLRAMRDDDLLARSFGIATARSRIVAWAVAGAVAGAAGGLFARYIGYIGPTSFGLPQTLTILTMVVVGGMGNLVGTAIGAVALVAIPEALSFIPATSNVADQAEPIIYSLALLVAVIFRPQGVIPERNLRSPSAAGCGRQAAGETAGDGPQAAGETAAEGETAGGGPRDAVPAPQATSDAIPEVRISGLSKHFGGPPILRDLNLELRPNEVTAILGPNGAGKTTLFNILTGVLKADGGEIRWGDKDLTSMSPTSLARLGVGRSFQDGRLFESMTVYEHVLIAGHARDNGLGAPLGAVSSPSLDAAALGLLADIGLNEVADWKVSRLSYGQQKTLMLGLLMQWSPSIMLLDELAAGLDSRTVHQVAERIRTFRDPGRIVCLVEHNLEFVWAAADRVVLLGEGQIIADGKPDEIRADPAAFSTYFGRTQLL